jgi:hypothetical protein
MSEFDKVASLYEQRQSVLFDLVSEVITRKQDIEHILEEKQKAPKQVKLLIPDFALDARWLSIDNVNPSDKNKFNKALSAVNLPRDISNIGQFIDKINNFISNQNVDVTNHSEAISRLQLLRMFWNLSQTKTNKVVSGYLFEVLMAITFGGRRLPPATGEEKNNLVDIEFPGRPVSLKFIATGKTDIKGSIKNLDYTLDKYQKFEYIVANKLENGIEFLAFTITEQNKKLLPNYVTDGTKTQFRGSLSKISEQIRMEHLGTINFGDIEAKTQAILQALNNKFEMLLSTLQDLNQQVVDLLYVTKSDKEVKQKAGRAADEAGKTKAAAEKVRDK